MGTITAFRRFLATSVAATLLVALGVPAASAAGPANHPRVAGATYPDGSGYPVSPSDDAFYTPPDPIPDVAPGTILRSRPVVVRGLGLPVPVRTFQVLYRSTDTQGRPDAVSGTVGVLQDGRPDADRPLVVYNIGTHGLGPLCAPSYLLRLGIDQEEPLMASAISRGYAVMVTDYEGLGTPGPHTYAAGPSTGHAVLDGARAALHLSDLGLNPKAKTAIWGYSEGGLASDWAAELASTYAPDVNLVGTAAGGVPANLEHVARMLDGTYGSGLLLAAAVGLNRAYPQLKLDQIFTPAGKQAAADIASQCVEQFAAKYAFKKLADYSTVPDPLGLPQVRAVLDANTLGRRIPSEPMHIYHATSDELLPLDDVHALVADYCRHGLPVDYREYPGEHLFVAGSGSFDALDWIAARFAGAPVPNNCARS
ncbi:MAG TPA: lipase family protein [Sporichthyaceae bacterium]|nr:lipase family protein [Sporichthyaceae bacterium]